MNIILGKSESNEKSFAINYHNLGALSLGHINSSSVFGYSYQTGFSLNDTTLKRGQFVVENVEENLLTVLRARAGETHH